MKEIIYNKWEWNLRKSFEGRIDIHNYVKLESMYLNDTNLGFNYNFFELPNIYPAVEILQYLFNNKDKNIVIYSDRDADGITSNTILTFHLKNDLKCTNIKSLIPLEDDKYGISETVYPRIIKEKPDVLFILDCGSSNKETINIIKSELPNIKIIILDHHFIPVDKKDYPDVDAFINPKILDESNNLRHLCTAGLSYYLTLASFYSFTKMFNKIYKIKKNNINYYVKNLLETTETEDLEIFINEPEFKIYPELSIIQSYSVFVMSTLANIYERTTDYLILSSIGTVADLVPLLSHNRIIVSNGLTQIYKKALNKNVNIQCIKSFSQLVFNGDLRPINEVDYGFTIIPMINACGRLGKSHVCLDFMLETDTLTSLKKLNSVKELNELRKTITKENLQWIIDNDKHILNNLVIVYGDNLHRGLSGLLANNVAEKYKRPAIVLVRDGLSIRGSARSYNNDNVFSFVSMFKDDLLSFGGHKQACGFSIDYDNLQNVIELFKKEAENNPEVFNLDNDMVNPIVPMELDDLNDSHWDILQMFAPYGQNNFEPIFHLKTNRVFNCKIMGNTKEHLKIEYKSNIGMVWFFFNADDSDLLCKDVSKIIVATLSTNYFRGSVTRQIIVSSVTQC